ncbi:hypothetical protein CRE_19529 [Caenorhabditis remanei]|uniref:Uncharacterized protein n=1 Tax=Caenorhabditis remanei TaxID=31234 RepID=E3NI14_CAERE|nr:hypothetical protein CRE_19529 [Caenorhabditis remanei]
MEDVPIETVKGRAKRRAQKLQNVNAINSPTNFAYFRDLFCCKCPNPCTWSPREAPSARTTSPTQLQRMVELVKLDPNLMEKDQIRELLLLSQSAIEGLSTVPDERTFSALATCPTLPLFAGEINGWEAAYQQCRRDLVRKHLGFSFGTTKTIQLICAPGVNADNVPVQASKMTMLKDLASVTENTYSQMLRHVTSIVAVVVPISIKEEDQDAWREIVNAVPSSAVVYLIPEHMTRFDHSHMAMFASLFGRVMRDQGELVVVSPDEICTDELNRPLYLVSERVSAPKYWMIVRSWLEEHKHQWPQFMVSDEKEDCIATGSRQVCEEATNKPGPSQPPAHRNHEWKKEGLGRGGGSRGNGQIRGGAHKSYHPYPSRHHGKSTTPQKK